MRNYYGVKVDGASGTSYFMCATRSVANRLRRVFRAWNGWTGASTLQQLCEMASHMKGARTKTIIKAFQAGAED